MVMIGKVLVLSPYLDESGNPYISLLL